MTNSIDSTPADNRHQHFGLTDRHPRMPVRVERILVPTNLTEESQKTIEIGLAMAQRFGAHMTLLHVYKQSYAVQFVRGPNSSDEVWKDRMHFARTLKLWAENARERFADCDAEFREGELGEEIARTAKERDVDLIVISTHHYNWLTRLAYGCDAEHILRHAPCPILIVQTNNQNFLGEEKTRSKTSLEKRKDTRLFDFCPSPSGKYPRSQTRQLDRMKC